MRIVRDFSAADGFRRDAHVDMIRREAQRERERWLPTLEPTLAAWTAVLALSLRVAAREDTAAIGP
jgi:hypothetical protein